ncbi:UDP-3-O-[3-hydroxymyristoyl] N-acetylglucosamine deacetylase [Albimonas donghaensis]|uniref:UDP-3-O-acyl-N-acetylglucosamine deacetylase n=1 Tax=Albimonas donghaensis TaxID=356660 RepID=A0A1H3EJ86_9RHOB|nr:UDP-3-O-acyl-N-acetylglucosamine deacetylase [Albimonas donghaensis]SDX78680.1 UDP-3-O-[3-hydroxymyristoyl] N-acetylglucosamine deacetylase [Albimonas donghaensis]
MQATVRNAIEFRGQGLHSGRPARLRILPASGNYGIWFKRVDVTDRDPMIQARWDLVSDTRLCTVISNREGVSVSTIEHIMAALAGCGVGNALVEIDGPEIPIMDGSAAAFAEAIRGAGLRAVHGEARAIRILRPVEIEDHGRTARLEPASRFEIDFGIDFADKAIGAQSLNLTLVNGAFMEHLADCRTFCRKAEVEAMQQAGLALGGSLANAIVVDGDAVVNPEGLRRPDEFVRHKMLDAVGDLALAGAPIIGRYIGRRGGHEMNNLILRALFARPDAWRFEVDGMPAHDVMGLRAAA